MQIRWMAAVLGFSMLVATTGACGSDEGSSSGAFTPAGSGAVGGTNAGASGGTSGVGGTTAGVGGSGGVGAASGTGAVGGSGATGGAAGDVQPTGGIGGAGGNAGMMAPAGEGGVGGTDPGGAGGVAGTEAPTACVTQAMTDSPTTTAECAACVCNACPDIMASLAGDAKANALIECGKREMCSGDCCMCNGGASACSTTTCTGYGTGPCVAEVLAAAGGAYPADEGGCWTDSQNATQLGVDCKAPGNSCKKATDLGTCVENSCKEICMGAPVCPPAAGGF